MAKPDDRLSDEEAARRRDEVVRRMIATPPKPHEPMKKGRSPKAPPKGK